MAAESGKLQAGAAQVEITPKMGTQLAGDVGRRRPAELLIEPLYARALVLSCGSQKLCIISLDLLAVTTECADEIRRQAAAELGCERGAIMVHDTQNHAAPSLGHFMISERTPHIPPELSWLRGGDDAYMPYAIERIGEAVRLAHAALEPVWVGAASGIEGRIAFNRRFVMRDGSTSTHPLSGSPLIRHVEGPTDPELGVICFTNESLRPVAMLLHHTCHPCHGYPHRYVIADWPGAWCDGIRQNYGGEVVPLVINGCCGNIHHRDHLNPHQVDDYRQMGQLLTDTTEEVLKDMRFQPEAILDWRSATLKIPLRAASPAEIEAARELLRQYPEPKWQDATQTSVAWDWFFAVVMLDLLEQREREPEMSFEIQAFRIGDAVVVGLPGEPFVEGQLRLKLESPAYPTYVAHHCNTSTNYIPTPQGLAAGGMEAGSCHAARLAAEALDILVDGAVALIKQLFP